MDNFRQLVAQGSDHFYKKGEYVFQVGQSNPGVYYIASGTLKAYYITNTGKEFVKAFCSAGDIITSMSAMSDEGVCSFHLLCLSNTQVKRIDTQLLREKSQNNVRLANDIINFLIHLAQLKEKREYQLLCLTAEERFNLLLEEKPQIFELVTQNDIARFLGITPVSLSRIKTKHTMNYKIEA